LATLGTAALSYATPIIRSGGPTRRRIALTKQGVELTRINGRTDTIPWKTRPTWLECVVFLGLGEFFFP